MKIILMLFIATLLAQANTANALKYYDSTSSLPTQVRAVADPNGLICAQFTHRKKLLYCADGSNSCNTKNGVSIGSFDAAVQTGSIVVNDGLDDICGGDDVYAVTLQ